MEGEIIRSSHLDGSRNLVGTQLCSGLTRLNEILVHRGGQKRCWKKLNLKKFEVLMCVAVNLSQNTWRCVDDAYMGLDISHGQLNFNLFAQQKMYAWKAQAKQNDAQTRE